MHYVYVRRSLSDHVLYIGYSANLRRRFQQHIKDDSVATSYRGPWGLIYYEAYLDQHDAPGREKYLKSGAGRRFLKAQLAHYLGKKCDQIRRQNRAGPSNTGGAQFHEPGIGVRSPLD
jgi:putative endonuclease